MASRVKQNYRREDGPADHPADHHNARDWRRRVLLRLLTAAMTAATGLRPGRRVTRRMSVLAFAVILLMGGCGDNGPLARFMLKPDHIIVERRPDQAYERLFPYYVELCATSQFRSKLKGEGGVAGHAVMYIKGACKDEKSAYPQLRRCRIAATDLGDPEHGAGVSVGRWFRNVNWVATPGYKLFYGGNLNADQRLTQAHFEATVHEAIEKGIYKGVEFHDYPSAQGAASLENFIENEGVGTDFALQFARSVFCARLPVTEPMVDEIIAFLNDKNREYAEGDADYNWSVWADNCAHTLRNALAAANIWSPLSVWAVKWRQIFNLAVPANEFVNLAELGTSGNIGDYREIQNNGPERDALHEFKWLPTRHGALLKTLPVHEPNDLYDTTFRLFTLQSPFRMGKTQRAIDLLSDARFVNLGDNLRYFLKKIRHDTCRAMTNGGTCSRASAARHTAGRERLFYEYIRAQRAEASSMLSRLSEFENHGDGSKSK